MGLAGVIKQFRLWSADWDERRRDHEYREPAERRSLELDNELEEADLEGRKLDNISRKLEIAKQYGSE